VARIDVEQLCSQISTIQEQMHQAQLELESARSSSAILQRDVEHFKNTINQKDQQISFLESHIAQLTQSISQLALPQMADEEKEERKHWWKFW
jgi:uncharacterized coiled-coil DUF342 family protein